MAGIAGACRLCTGARRVTAGMPAPGAQVAWQASHRALENMARAICQWFSGSGPGSGATLVLAFASS